LSIIFDLRQEAAVAARLPVGVSKKSTCLTKKSSARGVSGRCLGFGALAGWCGTGISRYVSFFGGMETPLVIPWATVSLGCAATVALCLAAALAPAVLTGRAEPLKLLQAGRADM
jgi:hypothetical protein